jgi:hypothetical protein
MKAVAASAVMLALFNLGGGEIILILAVVLIGRVAREGERTVVREPDLDSPSAQGRGPG